jgi:hypothetical protein
VITAGDGRERLEEFHDLVHQLCECYEPVGPVEESLVQTIATCWWRKARVIRAENGEVRRQLDTLKVDRALRDSDSANLSLMLSEGDLYQFDSQNQADQQVSSMERWLAKQATQSDLRKHRSSLEYLSAPLQSARSDIISNGYLSEPVRKRIVKAFGLWDCLFALTCLNTSPKESKMGDPTSEKLLDEQADDKRAAAVAAVVFIDAQLERISAFKEFAKQRETLELDAEARSFSLPPADATDKLLRYEAHLDKQLYRAMDELERLQRRRRGENIPPPLNINLGRGK